MIHTTLSVRHRARALIAIGLLGMAFYAILVRTAHPAFLDSDTAHGTWTGVCVGLELVGLAFLVRASRSGRVA